jgi:hypothetical protein
MPRSRSWKIPLKSSIPACAAACIPVCLLMVFVDLKRLFKQAMSEHRPINQHQSILTF